MEPDIVIGRPRSLRVRYPDRCSANYLGATGIVLRQDAGTANTLYQPISLLTGAGQREHEVRRLLQGVTLQDRPASGVRVQGVQVWSGARLCFSRMDLPADRARITRQGELAFPIVPQVIDGPLVVELDVRWDAAHEYILYQLGVELCYV